MDDQEKNQAVYVTNDILLNTLRIDNLKTAESFDLLYEKDLHEMSALLGQIAFLTKIGLEHVYRKNDELRIIVTRIILNSLNTFLAAVTVLRNGYYLQASILVRSIFETTSTALYLIINPSDLKKFQDGNLETRTVNLQIKKIFPSLVKLYGLFSNTFVHISPLYSELHPLQTYKQPTEELNANIDFLRASIWFVDVVVDLLFSDVKDNLKYWKYIEPHKFIYKSSEEMSQWAHSFLRLK